MSDNNNIPAWITADLFVPVLKKNVQNFKQIKNFRVGMALAPGENYAAVMLKVYIDCILQDGQIKDQTYMLKVSHDNELQKTELSKWHMFATESGMYREIIPAMEKLYQAKGLKVKFGAIQYQLPVTKEYLLLEDLTQRGFRNAKRQDCLDMEHCKGVLKKLGQYHAASVAYMQQNGPFPKLFTQGMALPEGRSLLSTMLTSGYKHVLQTSKEMGTEKIYHQQLEDYADHLVDTFYKQSKMNENEFNVLNHGDCWSNNIMFQYNADGSLKETYFVDLQMPCFGTPAQDLLYFIISSAHFDLKINRFDEMIRYYHDQLIEHLKILEYSKPLPLLRDIYQMIIKYGVWAVFTILTTMGAVLCEPTDTANIDNFVGNSEESDDFKRILFSNERFKKHLAILIPWLCNRGVFEL